MSRHLMARFRHLAAVEPGGTVSRHLMAKVRQAKPDDGWQEAILPHTDRSAYHFEARHGNSGSLPIRPEQFRTKLVNHGETRYALQVMDSTDGWAEWSIHRQTGPDITDPDHWERMGVPGDVHQFCHCVGDDGDEADMEYPAGGEDGFAGYTAKPARAEAEAERAFQNYTDNLGHGLGEYDVNDVARGGAGLDEPEGGYDIFGDGAR